MEDSLMVRGRGKPKKKKKQLQGKKKKEGRTKNNKCISFSEPRQNLGPGTELRIDTHSTMCFTKETS